MQFKRFDGINAALNETIDIVTKVQFFNNIKGVLTLLPCCFFGVFSFYVFFGVFSFYFLLCSISIRPKQVSPSELFKLLDECNSKFTV